jgi:hypothetical protein
MEVDDSSTDVATEIGDESAFLSDESSFYGMTRVISVSKASQCLIYLQARMD